MLVVSGCGRSGTGYIAEVLRRAGVACGHEDVFTLDGVHLDRGFAAESSWLAAPLWGDHDVTRVVLWRDPVEVVRSLLRRGLFRSERNPWRRYIAEWLPEVDGELAAAMAYWSRWNALALTSPVDLVINVERPDWASLEALLGEPLVALSQAACDVARDVNTDPGPKPSLNESSLNDACRDTADVLAGLTSWPGGAAPTG